jgi:hypothetical protein
LIEMVPDHRDQFGRNSDLFWLMVALLMRADLAMAPIVTALGLGDTGRRLQTRRFGSHRLHPRGQDVLAAQGQHATL